MDENSLEENVIQVFEKVGCNTGSSNTEMCLRLSKKNERVIGRLSGSYGEVIELSGSFLGERITNE